MAETLLAILLVTSSAKGSSLVFSWPPSPTSAPRYSRARPGWVSYPRQVDNPWRASNSSDLCNDDVPPVEEDETEYQWQRPTSYRDRSISFSHSPSRPASGRTSPIQDDSFHVDESAVQDDYDEIFGYSPEFLAGLLCPHKSLCHQKFELLVDDLAFIGHPVCAETDGVWRFKPEKIKPHARGREARIGSVDEASLANTNRTSSKESENSNRRTWLQIFHLVLVLDLPDPSSSASGNVSKYFDIVYEQIAFTVAAVLFQEQVLSNFVEIECDVLGSLKDTCVAKGDPMTSYVSRALEVSSIAPAMKTIFECIKSSTVACITIHDLPLELQLPPYLDVLLHNEDDELDALDSLEDEGMEAWGPEMSFGWNLPALVPWKSLLLLDNHTDMDPYINLQGPHVSASERTLAEGLIKFLEIASVTLSLADMASLLEWNLETQVFPIVRWLVLHRRAKVVDVVHTGLKTVFTLPPKFDQPLSLLSAEFKARFSHPPIPPLPEILATVSGSQTRQSDNHFFASVVKSKDLIPLYHDVVVWMLKRDMLITLHLRIRIIATHELKARVQHARNRSRTKKETDRKYNDRSSSSRKAGNENGVELSPQSPTAIAWLPFSPKSARRYSWRAPSTESGTSQLSELNLNEDDDEQDMPDDDDLELDDEKDDSGEDALHDNLWPSLINDPARATPLERRWLSAMSEGRDPYIARRFEQINQYFDGKRTDDEILYRADISRRQLREVLHHYEEYLQTFLHPS